MKTTRSLRGLAVIGLLSLGFVNLAQAQTLPVDVDITIDPDGISILNYYSELDVTISPVSLAELQNSSFCPPTAGKSECPLGAGSAGTATTVVGVGGGELHSDGAIALVPGNNLDTLRLDMDNVWAARAVGGADVATTVSILLGAHTTLENPDTVSFIVIEQAKIYQMDGPGLPGNSVSFTDPGLITPVFGGVQLTLDMTMALGTGVYSSSAAAVAENYLIGITGT